MKQESTYARIQRKSGMKPTNCKCKQCASQCKMPCKGTPEDFVNLIAAGYSDRVMITEFAGVQIGMPLYDKDRDCCTFFKDGLCELHDKGLKPTEGKLSHHSTSFQSFNPKKSISHFVVQEWANITEDQFSQLLESKAILNK